VRSRPEFLLRRVLASTSALLCACAGFLGACGDPGGRSPPAARVTAAVAAATGPSTGPSTVQAPRSRPEFVEIRTSNVPTAGDGLFATAPIEQGAYIGDYTGRYLTQAQSDALPDFESSYLFELPDCADTAFDDIAGDPRHFISKANFAPSFINGVDTNLQNVEWETFCTEPYVRMFAVRDIAVGDELFVDYGEDYGYEFMERPAVQQYFLELSAVDPAPRFSFEYSMTPGMGAEP
jgi:hypothetical protein